MTKLAIVLNDTRTCAHPGCHLVMRQIEHKCKSFNIEILRSFRTTRRLLHDLEPELTRCDIVIINGEGTMHHDQLSAKILCKAAELASLYKKPIYLINAVWQENNEINHMLSLLAGVYVRESLSNKSLLTQKCLSVIVPDLTLSCDTDQIFSPLEMEIKRSVIVVDNVRQVESLLLEKFAKKRGYFFYRMVSHSNFLSFRDVYRKLKLIAGHRVPPVSIIDDLSFFKNSNVVVTGRFHGVCLAILARRPFVAISSNTHKIEGLIRDAELGSGGVVLSDKEIRQNSFDIIDMATQNLLSCSRSGEFLKEYQARCDRYILRARKAVDEMFFDISK